MGDDLRAVDAWRDLGADVAHGAVRADCALGADGTLRPGRAVRSGRAWGSLRTGKSRCGTGLRGAVGEDGAAA